MSYVEIVLRTALTILKEEGNLNRSQVKKTKSIAKRKKTLLP